VNDTASHANWIVEITDGATMLERNGYNARTLKTGDVVTAQAVTAPAEQRHAFASSVVLGTGGAQLFKLSLSTPSTFGPVPRWPDGQVQLGPPEGARGYWRTELADSDAANVRA